MLACAALLGADGAWAQTDADGSLILWQGELTPASFTSTDGSCVGYSNFSGDGTLSPRMFSEGSNSWTVTYVCQVSGSGFHLAFTNASDSAADLVDSNLKFHVDSTTFSGLTDSTNTSAQSFEIPSSGLTLTAGTTYTLKFTRNKAPSAPTNVRARGGSATEIKLAWSPPEKTGGTAITGYKIEVSNTGTGSWTDLVASQTGTTYSHTVASGVTRYYRVSAINAAGTSAASGVVSATAADTAPALLRAQMTAGGFLLLFDEAFTGPLPDKSAFTVKVTRNSNTVTNTVSAVVEAPQILTLTLTDPVSPGETLTISYTKPGTNPLKDAANNEVASFTDQAVTNLLPATAPDAPGNLAASPGTDAGTMELTWDTPWDNGDAITEFEVRYAAGISVPPATTWEDITNSGASTTSHTVTGLTAGMEYTFEVRAVNGEGNGAEASVTATLLAPTWEFTLTDSSNNNVTELTEGGDPATATVSITNSVRFGTNQTVTLEWGNFDITHGLIQGAGGATAITITAGQSSGTLEISSPQVAQDRYQRSFTQALKAKHGGTQIGSIQLTFVDDEDPSVASITDAPTTVNEGEDIEIEITLTPPHGDLGVDINFAVTDSSGALSGTLPTERRFAGGQVTNTVTLTTDDNTTQNDGARDVTLTLALNDDFPYTLGTTSSVTIEVRDNDTPPTAPRNLTAQAGNTTARLTWQAPAPPVPDHGQPVTHYEYQVKVGSGSFSSWAPIPNGDATTTSHTFTGLANNTPHTFEVRAANVAGGGAAASTTVTPIVGVGVSFGAAALSVDEGDMVTVTVTLGAAPAASVTVPITATPGAGLEATEYSGVPSSVVFNAGETSKSFTVTTVEDTADEPDAVLTLAFGPLPAGHIVGTHAELALTVVDDDVPIVSATFDRATATASEGGSVAVTVRLSQAPEREVVLPLVATPGANLDADEYEGVPASVAIGADATQARFTVAFADDAVEEGNETLTLTFGARPAGVTSGANPQLVLTVTDDDGPPAAPDVSAQTGDGFVTLSWDPVANDSPILRYEVRVDGGAWQSVGLETSYQYEDLENGREYAFDVRAVNAHGNGDEASAPGTPSQVLTRIPTAPQVLQVNATDSGRAELSWIQPANGTDQDYSSNPNSTMSQLQGYRIDVCRTACDDEANWYALVPNTRKFEHQYVHQVLAPDVIRENHYRVQAININGKPGPWSDVATLAPTVLENVRLQTPDDSTLRVRFKVRNPDGNPLHVRYGNTGPVDARDGNTGTGTVGYAERRLTKAGDVTLELTGLDAGSWYRVDLDFADTFDSARMQSHRHGTARAGKTPLKSPYAVDAVDAQVFAGGVWRDAPDTQLGVRMGGTGRYRLRLKPCDGERTVIARRIQSPAGRLEANPMEVDPSLLDLACGGDDPGAWREVAVTALALADYPSPADALLSAPFAVVHNHEVWRDTSETESTLVSEGTGLVRVAVERPAGATLPEPTGVAIADPAAGGNPVMSWDAVPGATAYQVNWRHGPHYRSGANADRSNQTGTSTALPLGGSRRGPITARVRAYSSSGVSGWVERTWDSRPPTLNVLDTAVNEDDGSIGFLVKLDPAASGTVTVDYATQDDTAVAGTDYTATSGTLTFAPGQRERKTAQVPITDDGEEDSGETFRLLLSNPTGSDADNGAAVLGDAEAVATIPNSEREAAQLTGFTLVDAGTNADLMVLADGATVALGELLARSYGIRAETSAGAAPGSVRLELAGAKTVTHTDDAAPYSLYGDGGGRLNGGSLPPGSYTLTATAYADSGGRGDGRARDDDAGAVRGGGRRNRGGGAGRRGHGHRGDGDVVDPGRHGGRRGRRGVRAHGGRGAVARGGAGLRGAGRCGRRRHVRSDGGDARGRTDGDGGTAGDVDGRERGAGREGVGGSGHGARGRRGDAGRKREHGPGCRRHADPCVDAGRRWRSSRDAVGCGRGAADVHVAVGSGGGDGARVHAAGDGCGRVCMPRTR